MRGAAPINTRVVSVREEVAEEGVHIVELFKGIDLGATRAVLAARLRVRLVLCAERDPISNRINEGVIDKLIFEYPGQINRGFIGWEKRLPQDVGLIGEMALVNLIAQKREVDMTCCLESAARNSVLHTLTSL